MCIRDRKRSHSCSPSILRFFGQNLTDFFEKGYSLTGKYTYSLFPILIISRLPVLRNDSVHTYPLQSGCRYCSRPGARRLLSAKWIYLICLCCWMKASSIFLSSIFIWNTSGIRKSLLHAIIQEISQDRDFFSVCHGNLSGNRRIGSEGINIFHVGITLHYNSKKRFCVIQKMSFFPTAEYLTITNGRKQGMLAPSIFCHRSRQFSIIL